MEDIIERNQQMDLFIKVPFNVAKGPSGVLTGTCERLNLTVEGNTIEELHLAAKEAVWLTLEELVKPT